MANPNVVPSVNFFGRPNGSVAYIENVSEALVKGYVTHNDGVEIPFETVHHGVCFETHGKVFYFADWKKLK